MTRGLVGVSVLMAGVAQLAFVLVQPVSVEVRHVALGQGHACVTTATGEAACWSWMAERPLGDSLEVVAQRPAGLPPMDSIVAGNDHTCGLADGAVWCWGSNRLGQLGRWSRDSSARPIRAAVAFVALSAGASHTCALARTQEIWCWGDQWEGSTGTHRTGETVRDPSPVLSKWPFSALAAGDRHTCAITNARRAVCWGDNATRAVRQDSWRTYFAPVEVPSVAPAASVYAGAAGSCILRRDGTPQCWGSIGRNIPAEVSRMTLRELAIGAHSACVATRGEGDVACWGVDTGAVVGRVALPSGERLRARELVSNGDRFCGVDMAERLWCWGPADRVAHHIRVLVASQS